MDKAAVNQHDGTLFNVNKMITTPYSTPALTVERSLNRQSSRIASPADAMPQAPRVQQESTLDAYDALIMLQIADAALKSASSEMSSISDLVLTNRKTSRRPEKNIYLIEQLENHLDRYAASVLEANYNGFHMLSLDAGDYLFELGNTVEHVIVLKHTFDQYATDYHVSPDGSYGYSLAHIPFIPGLLFFDPLGLKKIEQLMGKLQASRKEIQDSLKEFTQAIEKFEVTSQ